MKHFPPKGKKYSKRAVVELEDASELLDYERVGTSFDSMLCAWVESAKTYLESRGLPHAPILYKVTDRPIAWEESEDPEDVEQALLSFELRQLLEEGPDGLEPPTVGRRLKPCINSTWEMKPAPENRTIGHCLLSHHIQKRIGFSHDSHEGLFSEIITKAHLLAGASGPTRDLLIAEISRIATLARVYSMTAPAQSKRAQGSRKPLLKRAIDKVVQNHVGTVKELWPHLFAALEEEGADPGEASDTLRYDYTEDSGVRTGIGFSAFQNRPEVKNTNKSS